MTDVSDADNTANEQPQSALIIPRARPRPQRVARPIPAHQFPVSGDAAVIGTSDDAATSKLSCVAAGYFVDPFLTHFVSHPARRPPLINRGYYARTAAIQSLLVDFLDAGDDSPRQIVSLGAGSDTSFFKLCDAQLPSIARLRRFLEVDFPAAIVAKASTIHKHRRLYELVEPSLANDIPSQAPHPESTDSVPVFNYQRLSLVGADMRNMADFTRGVELAGIDYSLPTMFLAECVLIYIKPAESLPLIQWSATRFTGGSLFLNYEQIHPNDPFGETMKKNLIARGCPLLGFDAYPTIADQQRRYIDAGYHRYLGYDMNEVYRLTVDRADVKRIERIELFDEFEEWHLIQAHYHLSCASKGEHPCVNLSLNRIQRGEMASDAASAVS